MKIVAVTAFSFALMVPALVGCSSKDTTTDVQAPVATDQVRAGEESTAASGSNEGISGSGSK